jgi:hypothetical protein
MGSPSFHCLFYSLSFLMIVCLARSILRSTKIPSTALAATSHFPQAVPFASIASGLIMASAEPASQLQAEQVPPAEFPKLSTSEFRAYNRLAEHMDLFVRLSPWLCGPSH